MNRKPRYRTWIRKKKIILFWCITVLFLAISSLGFIYPVCFFALTGVALFGYISAVISLTAFRLSPSGGDYQNRIHSLILRYVRRPGKILDIGCGSGNLIIKIARQHAGGRHYGLDYWGNDWEYSQKQCEENADIEQVKNISFAQGSASALPFENGSFDTVVSCLTFHEVAGSADKTLLLKEALRVLKRNGNFIFFDLFDDHGFYNGEENIKQAVINAGGGQFTYKRLSEYMRLPYPLQTKKVLRYGVLITGTKMSP
jgi:ubiquinone/menaquinone biosynthesis C-methylase UbiE